MNTFNHRVVITLVIPLLLAGYSDELSGQAKQATGQIAEEAKKAASQKIEEIKNQTIEQIRQAVKERLATTEGQKQQSESAEKKQ